MEAEVSEAKNYCKTRHDLSWLVLRTYVLSGIVVTVRFQCGWCPISSGAIAYLPRHTAVDLV
jgi:hypothetical protein